MPYKTCVPCLALSVVRTDGIRRPSWHRPRHWQTSTDLTLLESLLASLAGPDVLPQQLDRARSLWHSQHGNLREVWFDLYDQFEQGHTRV